MPRPGRLGARRGGPADRGRADGRGARRRGDEQLAAAGRSRRPGRERLRRAAGACSPRRRGRGPWRGHAALAHGLLGDDPAAILARAAGAVRGRRAPPISARRSPTRRRCGWRGSATANEHGDWETAHHVFTYANAVHQGLERIGAGPDGAGWPEAVRGVLHGAMAVYLAPLPERAAGAAARRGGRPAGRPADGPGGAAGGAAGRVRPPQQVDAAGRLVARYLLLGHPAGPLIATLAHALLREDAGFHACQMLEAGVRQYQAWGDTDEGRHVLVAVARYLAAHSRPSAPPIGPPTSRGG